MSNDLRNEIEQSLNKINDALGVDDTTPTSEGDGRKRASKRTGAVDQPVRTGSVLVVDGAEHPALLVWFRHSGQPWQEAWPLEDEHTEVGVQVMVQAMGYFADADVSRLGDRVIVQSFR